MNRPRFNIATVIFVAAIVVATTLVIVILRNPATHANLEDPEFYDRTELAYLDREYTYVGYGSSADQIRNPSDRWLAGKNLFTRAGCIGCHGTHAQGATVGGTLWDVPGEEFADFVRDVREGPSGMPAYTEIYLTDDDLALILTFLEGAPGAAADLGITTTTTTRPPAPTTTVATTTTTPGNEPPGETTTTTMQQQALVVEAPAVTGIVVDGDPSDWDAIPGVELTLEPIQGESAPPHAASIKVAHDDEFVYVLYTVDDDFNWSEVDPHYSGAPAVMWPIESAAGPHMGSDDPSGMPALGMVDIWYWRLDCPIGEEQGGAAHGPGNGDPGNDGTCNFDDEWATNPETHDDDVGDTAENSLLGVFSHSNPIEDGDGTWYFEMRRPLQTGDEQDAQFSVGESSQLALAYWDPDAGQNGWGRRDHVQSSHLGWIEVIFAE